MDDASAQTGSFSARFQSIAAVVLDVEQGYWVDPNGGPTNFGISSKSYPTENIETLTQDRALSLYHRDYWTPIHGDEIPLPVAVLLFDAAINQGAVTSIKMLQQAVGAVPDGIIGRETLGKVARMDPKDILIEFCALRAFRYAQSKNIKLFGHGWYRRLMGMTIHAIT